MQARRIDTLRHALGALALTMAATAGAAPLRLSLDSLAVAGPTGESVEPADPALAEPADAGIAAEDLSFVAAPDLQFPDPAAHTGALDDEWLQTARVQQDEAAADRSLGEFAPAATPVLTISTDPIDEVTLVAARADPVRASGAEAAAHPSLSEGLAWAWMAAPLLALGGGLAVWASRGTRPAGVHRSAPRGTRRQAMQVV